MASTVLGNYPSIRSITDTAGSARRRARAHFWRAALAGLSLFWISLTALVAMRLF
ncbi:hypothetical protein [Altererythrobacter lauratis]|uniref:DUF2474 domain-containing protein n=1 Tax=Alteraurantiacibacter lauratis TaxID=2054627 RepID=A0ABV7EGL4_9SPHN